MEVDPGLDKAILDNSDSESICSYTSEDLEHLDDIKKKYDEAPEDVYFTCDGEHLKVLKAGEKVPCLTKYKKIRSGTALAKFGYMISFASDFVKKSNFSSSVSEYLEVKIIKSLEMKSSAQPTVPTVSLSRGGSQDSLDFEISRTPARRSEGASKRRIDSDWPVNSNKDDTLYVESDSGMDNIY